MTPPPLGMKTHVSPRQLADALGVSESSVKRWADQGLMAVERTAGGHRRLPIGGVIQFLRASDLSLVQPAVLGLPAAPGQGEAVGDPAEAADGELVQALEVGDEERFRAVVFRLYVEGESAARICDRHVAAAFHALGERWEHGRLEVYRERRGIEVCQKVLHELRQAVPPPPPGAPRAAGGTLQGDWYGLPTAMVELALREAGWQAQSYGCSHPVETLLAAVREQAPRLFWLSVSDDGSLGDLEDDVTRLDAACAAHGATLVLGGRALHGSRGEALRRRLRSAAFCHDLVQLQDLAAALAPASRPDNDSDGTVAEAPRPGSGEPQ